MWCGVWCVEKLIIQLHLKLSALCFSLSVANSRFNLVQLKVPNYGHKFDFLMGGGLNTPTPQLGFGLARAWLALAWLSLVWLGCDNKKPTQ